MPGSFQKQYVYQCEKQLVDELRRRDVSAAAVEALISVISSLSSGKQKEMFRFHLNLIETSPHKYAVFSQAIKVNELRRLFLQFTNDPELETYLSSRLIEALNIYQESGRTPEAFEVLRKEWEKEIKYFIPRQATKTRFFGVFKPHNTYMMINMLEQLEKMSPEKAGPSID